jgi:hypothetical protein
MNKVLIALLVITSISAQANIFSDNDKNLYATNTESKLIQIKTPSGEQLNTSNTEILSSSLVIYQGFVRTVSPLNGEASLLETQDYKLLKKGDIQVIADNLVEIKGEKFLRTVNTITSKLELLERTGNILVKKEDIKVIKD